MGMAVFLWVVFFPSAEGLLWGAEEKSAETDKSLSAEREKAIKESVLKLKKKFLVGEARAKKEEASMPEKGTKRLPAKEMPVFYLAEIIQWEGNQDRASLEIVGEEDTLPAGEVDTSLDGRSIRWRPAQTLVVMKKKENPVESPFLQRVAFKEDVAMTKKLGLEAPYYVLREILLTFSVPVSYKVTQEGAWLSIEFSPSKKIAVPEEEKIGARQVEISMPEMTSPGDILGTSFQAKEIFEAYVTGGGKAGEAMKKLRSEERPGEGIFDGRGGFPHDMTPVFEEAYPAFGTQDYWKRHVRAALDQTFGYSSDFDGFYGANGTSTKAKAFTLDPNVNIAYNALGFGKPFRGTRTPTGSLDVGYSAARMFPLGNRNLNFGDGARLQTVDFGGTYSPKKRYSLSCQNKIVLFASKAVGLSSGDWVRNARHGYRMTHAAGINYRLTRRLLWKNGIGFERTRSDAPEGRSRNAIGYLNTGFTQTFTRRVRLNADYTYEHIFKDTGAPTNSLALVTKDKDIHSISMSLGYTKNRQWSMSAGPELSVIEGPPPYGDIFAFGGRAQLRYQWRPQDSFQVTYSNRMIQDGTGILVSGLLGRNIRDTSITERRVSQVGVSYVHTLDSGALSLSLDYYRWLPLDGLFPRQTTKTDIITFQTSWRRRIFRGRSWLELIYRYSNYLSRGLDPADVNTDSDHEHAVLFTIGTYFGA